MALANLKDIYIDQLQDIHSACNQSAKVTRELAGVATDGDLKSALDAGVARIAGGTPRGGKNSARAWKASSRKPVRTASRRTSPIPTPAMR